MLENENVPTFINRMSHMEYIRYSIGVSIEKLEMAMEAINGLPGRLDNLINALYFLGN